MLATPFVRPDGEGIEVELIKRPDGIANLSDMGSTISYLYVNGLTLNRSLIDLSQKYCTKPRGTSSA